MACQCCTMRTLGSIFGDPAANTAAVRSAHRNFVPQGSHICRHLDERRMLPWIQDQLSCLCALHAPNLALHMVLRRHSAEQDLAPWSAAHIVSGQPYINVKNVARSQSIAISPRTGAQNQGVMLSPDFDLNDPHLSLQAGDVCCHAWIGILDLAQVCALRVLPEKAHELLSVLQLVSCLCA